MGILDKASIIPLTEAEIRDATTILDEGRICVASLQRRMQIGWRRAADLIEHIKGRDALPSVARR